MYYKDFGQSPYPYGCTYPKAPSGRELPTKSGEGERVTIKLAQTQIHSGSFRHATRATSLSEGGFLLVPLYHKSAEKTISLPIFMCHGPSRTPVPTNVVLNFLMRTSLIGGYLFILLSFRPRRRCFRSRRSLPQSPHYRPPWRSPCQPLRLLSFPL